MALRRPGSRLHTHAGSRRLPHTAAAPAWATPGAGRRGQSPPPRELGRRGLVTAPFNDDVVLAKMKIYAEKQQTGVSMRTLLDTGHGALLGSRIGSEQLVAGNDEICIDDEVTKHQLTMLQIATFLRHELPIRFAHRARELDNLPEGLYQMANIQKVKHWYMESFADIEQHEVNIDTMSKEKVFQECMIKIKERHADTNVAIAQGLIQFQEDVLSKKVFSQVCVCIQQCHHNVILTIMTSVLPIMTSVFKMMNFVFQMMDSAGPF